MKGAGYLAFALAGVAAFIWGVLQIPSYVMDWTFIIVPIFFAGCAAYVVVCASVDGLRALAAGRPQDVPWAGMTAGDAVLLIVFLAPTFVYGGMALNRLCEIIV